MNGMYTGIVDARAPVHVCPLWYGWMLCAHVNLYIHVVNRFCYISTEAWQWRTACNTMNKIELSVEILSSGNLFDKIFGNSVANSNYGGIKDRAIPAPLKKWTKWMPVSMRNYLGITRFSQIWFSWILPRIRAVSYTHLDVYKRQLYISNNLECEFLGQNVHQL